MLNKKIRKLEKQLSRRETDLARMEREDEETWGIMGEIDRKKNTAVLFVVVVVVVVVSWRERKRKRESVCVCESERERE